MHVSLGRILDIHQLDNEYEWLTESVAVALLLQNIESCALVNVTIHNSKGCGLLALNLLGISIIELCTFSSNNVQTELEKRMGGNALFLYHYGNLNDESTSAYLSISNTYILNGIDSSEIGWKDHCGGETDFRANGLVILVVKPRFAVNIILTNVIFSENHGSLHPSVVILGCYTSQTASKIQLVNCSFKNGESLMIELQFVDHSNYYEHSKHYKLIEIKNSSFSEGVTTSRVSICILKDPSEAFSELDFRYDIVIDSCMFEHIGLYDLFTEPVIQINQTISGTCPQVTVKLLGSVFQNNYVPALQFASQALEHWNPTCPSLIVRDCTYCHNQIYDKHLVSIELLTNYKSEVWKYEEASKLHGWKHV